MGFKQMRTYESSENDGTIAITYQVSRPMQGTLIIGDASDVTVAKGIMRPPMLDEVTGDCEPEMFCKEAGFGKTIAGQGQFYKLGDVGKQRCRLAYQTVLFSARDPADIIKEDSRRFETQTAMDLLGLEARRKISVGIPPALLMDEMAPWDAFRQLQAKGIRATVYGSELVPPPFKGNESYFMLLPDAAELLAEQLEVEVDSLINQIFLIHRDPALPDGTSLFPSVFYGILKWANDEKDGHGIVLHPKDPYWNAAGGDFDGDAANVYFPAPSLVPRGAVDRPDFKVAKRNYVGTSVTEQILEQANESVTQLLGPTILGAMRLFERGEDSEYMRAILAGVAQASVQAKKHSVDSETVLLQSQMITDMVRRHGDYRPYVSDFLNALNQAKGTEAKVAAWSTFVDAVNAGTWEEGTRLEAALADRARILDQLFKDTDYFLTSTQAALPKPMLEAARAKCSPESRIAMSNMARQYREVVAQSGAFEEDSELTDEEVRETYKADLIDKMRTMRGKFELACITGQIDGEKFTPREAQIALIANGPARLAARFVPAAIFEEIGVNTKRMICQLGGHRWSNRIYEVGYIKPIPACAHDFALFSKDLKECHVEVISKSPRSTRVLITAQ